MAYTLEHTHFATSNNDILIWIFMHQILKFNRKTHFYNPRRRRGVEKALARGGGGDDTVVVVVVQDGKRWRNTV